MRQNNWRSNLYNYFDDVRRIPYDDDINNCIQFIANGWIVMRPDDPFNKYRKHTTMQSLLRAVKKDGFDKHSDFFATFMREYDHPSQGKVGDIALFATDDAIGEASGWIIGERVMVLRPSGLASLPLADAIKAFEV